MVDMKIYGKQKPPREKRGLGDVPVKISKTERKVRESRVAHFAAMRKAEALAQVNMPDVFRIPKAPEALSNYAWLDSMVEGTYFSKENSNG